MNRNLILVFILLATLSVANALPNQLVKRQIKWEKCTENYPLVNVDLSSDSIVPGQEYSFNVSGNLNTIIDSGFILSVGFHDNHLFTIASVEVPICGAFYRTDCPINSNTDFSASLVFLVPKNLPNPYSILVLISDKLNKKVQGCTEKKLGN
ncbi:hypothetical protein Glove_114g82 [Diversispora epigaea]|uniref:MD-2-related lipid-recognition domain-containing protein n=1 Tax=Diversispora epigaea TaxID=1348612 RepID=A0A397J5U3_9GLOM|nr:hypothetical protein Glove_114g82 [Diversispora epigaea]